MHASSIQFETLITDLGEGYEKRYCRKIRPVREFTLTFEKNAAGRDDFISFFQSVKGQGDIFSFTWEEAKGGNGATYTCVLNKDVLEANWKDYGFIDSELSFSCIDEESYSPPASLSGYHKTELDFESEYATIKDKEMTASFEGNRFSQWDNPRRRWTLTYELNETDGKELEAFFISKKGRWAQWSWTWSADKDGDGNTYTVRFDTDELRSRINDEGFREIQVPIRQVFPLTPTPTDEELKDYVIPRRLLKIEPKQGDNILILDNDTLASLTYSGDTYLGAPLEMSERKADDNNECGDVTVTISNAGLAISNLISTYGDVVTGCTCSLYRVWLNTSTYAILADPAAELEVYGKANNFKLDDETASINIEPMYPGYDISIPAMTYGVGCQWKFKDCNCRYTGAQVNCDHTLTTCKRYNNVENYGGFPSLPKEMIIKT